MLQGKYKNKNIKQVPTPPYVNPQRQKAKS